MLPNEIVGLEDTSSHPNLLVYAKSGAGKGHPYGTNILTPDGWQKIENLEIGSVIMGSNGKPQQITGVFDRGELESYQVSFHDGSSIIVDVEHLWYVKDVWRKQWRTRSTAELIAMKRALSGFSIPLVNPIEHYGTTVIGGYMMGVLLANGSLSEPTPLITTNDEEIINYIIKENIREDIKERKRPIGCARVWRWSKGAKVLRDYYGLYGVKSKDKFIPEEFFWSTVETRKALLAGLIDCDGSIDKRKGKAEYFTRSKDLAFGIRRLVESLGGIALINCWNDIDYRVSIHLSFNPFKLMRKANLWNPSGNLKYQHQLRRRFKDIEYVGKRNIRCISVSAKDKLYVTERYIVTHNTVFSTSDDSVLLLNTEPAGEISAKRMGSKAVQWKIRSRADMDKVYNWAATLAESGKEIPFKWFVVDSLTEYQDIEMREILAEGLAKKSTKDPFVPEWQDYLKNQKRLIRRVKEFNSLPVNMLYTCLVKNATDTEGNEFLYPAIHGKGYEIAQMVLAQMTSYGYLYVKDRIIEKEGKRNKVRNRYIIWEDSGSMQGKDRTFSLAPYTMNATLKEVRYRIENYTKENGKVN